MGVFVVVAALGVLAVVLLAPLMLPGAIVVLLVLAMASFLQHHHPHRGVHPR